MVVCCKDWASSNVAAVGDLHMISEGRNADFTVLRAAMTAGLIVALFVGTAVSGAYEDGTLAYQRHDYAAAMRILRPLADQGYSRAQFYLGVMYEKGQSVPRSDAEAAKWFQKAAEQWHSGAQFYLGSMYYFGDGVPQSYAEATKWYLKAAKQGDGGAQSSLGRIYE